MTNFFQHSNFNKYTVTYTLSMLLSTGKKNCSAMAREVNIIKEKLYLFFKNPELRSKEIKNSLIDLIKENHSELRQSVLIVDPTGIRKWFAKKIEGLACDYDGVIGKSKTCLSPVVAAWSNGKMTLPFDFAFWMNRKFTDFYQKKSDLTKNLILEFIKVIQVDYVALDGAFASLEMFEFFNEIEIHFCMRIARNRIVISENGIKAQLQNHPELKLKGNQRYKTIKATYKGFECFFTAHKVYSKNRKPRIVYIVSDLDISAKEQAEAYDIRWEIEEAFRTMKQSLGLADCQCLSAKKQRAHIFATFLAYAKLQVEKNKLKLKNPEEVIRLLRHERYPKRIKRRRMERVIHA